MNNLLGNAVKYTDAGGIILRMRCQSPKNGDRLTVNNYQRMLFFEVEDTGVGISPDNLERIFEPFAQATDAEHPSEDVGLGLAISRQHIQLLGGRISVESEPGKGTTFSVELPFEPSTEIVVLKRQSTRRVIGLAPDQPMFNILIVEDDDNSRIVLRQLLEQVGFSVIEAKDSRRAVEICKQMQPDLIWMDIRLPVMDGLEATRRIRERELKAQGSKHSEEGSAQISAFSFQPSARAKRVPIIALTASVFEEDKEKVLEAGCDDFVRKPFHEEEIFDKMAQYLDVSYIYQKSQPSEGKPETQALTCADLADLPEDLVKRINEAAKGAASKKLLELLQQIPPDFIHVADALADLVSQYQFSTIIALTEKENRDG